MPSAAFTKWESDAQRALDEIEAAHRAVEGSGRGRRYATLQINHAYAVLVSSQFQGFCRDLHSEAVSFLASSTTPPAVSGALRLVMSQGRKLDSGNPNPGNIGSYFARLGMDLWSDVKALDARGERRHDVLLDLNEWRNAIAHQDWTKVGGRPTLHLGTVQGWRSTCRALARSFDRAVRAHLEAMVGSSPW